MLRNKLLFYLIILFANTVKCQSDGFSYYKADAIFSSSYINGKFSQENQEAINVYIKKDNVFKTYSIYYINKNRTISFVYFKTREGLKYLLASTINDSGNNNEPKNLDCDIFLYDEYFLIDKLEKENKLLVLNVDCPDTFDMFCNIETKGIISDRYRFSNIKKITKNDYIKRK